jgi:hypothetical protein
MWQEVKESLGNGDVFDVGRRRRGTGDAEVLAEDYVLFR